MNSDKSQRRLLRIRRRRLLVANTYLMLRRATRYLSPILRGLLGVLLVILGLLGFLPILGFWMIPLGLALLATDLPPMSRWIRKQLIHHRHRNLRDYKELTKLTKLTSMGARTQKADRHRG